MRSTTRIMWLLLSLSFLLHSVCSDDDSTDATSVTKEAAAVTAGTTSDSKPVSTVPSDKPTVAATTGHTGGAGQGTKPTQATTKPAAADPTPAIPKTATSITDQPATTVPQVAVTNSPTVKPKTVSNVLTTVKIVATSAGIIDQPTTTLRSVPTDAPVTTSGPAIVQTSKAPVHPGTTAAFTSAVNPGNVGTSQSTGVSTGAPTVGPQLPAGTTVTPKTSPDHSRGGITGTTAPVQSHTHTPSVAPGPAAGSTALAPITLSPPTKTPEAGTLEPKAVPTTSPTPITTTRPTTISLAPAQPKTFEYSLNKGHENKEEKDLVEVCKRLMVNMIDGNCTLTWRHHNGKVLFDCVEINGKVKTNLATQYYEDITKKPTDNKTLIAILASCGALLIMIVILAVCASHHRKPYNENQQHLTEELHTVENGYHDNPTLEVMEVQPEMQEKKMMSLNGEFNDSWIVPIDNLKEDMPDEEDTHL